MRAYVCMSLTRQKINIKKIIDNLIYYITFHYQLDWMQRDDKTIATLNICLYYFIPWNKYC